jgi:hypothetical protein
MVKITFEGREIELTPKDFSFILSHVTGLNRKDIENQLLWLLSGDKQHER